MRMVASGAAATPASFETLRSPVRYRVPKGGERKAAQRLRNKDVLVPGSCDAPVSRGRSAQVTRVWRGAAGSVVPGVLALAPLQGDGASMSCTLSILPVPLHQTLPTQRGIHFLVCAVSCCSCSFHSST